MFNFLIIIHYMYIIFLKFFLKPAITTVLVAFNEWSWYN